MVFGDVFKAKNYSPGAGRKVPYDLGGVWQSGVAPVVAGPSRIVVGTSRMCAQ